MNRLRLFLVGTEFCRTQGGIQYVNRLLARAFREIAASTPLDLTIFSYGDRPSDIALDKSVAHGRAFDRSGMRMGLALARELLRQQPDVVLFTHVSLLPFARFARRLAPRARTALLAHGIEVWKPLEKAARRALLDLDTMVAPSAYTAAQLREQNGATLSRITVIPHSLDPEWTATQPISRCTTPTLLSVARLNLADRPKGIDVVLRAMPHILKRIPEARYVIVGDGNDRGYLKQLAHDVGVSDSVEFRGEVGGDTLRRIFASADVFVLPSTKEGFGIVFAEAMWHRLPVVAARAGAAPEVVEDGVTGMLVPPDSPEQVASAVSGLLLLEGERERMGAAGRRRVEGRFLFPHFVSRWHRWLAELAPEAVYLARHVRLDGGTPATLPSVSP